LPPTPGAALPGVAPSSDRTSALAKSYELEAKLDFKSAVETLRPLVNASAKDYFLRLRLAYLEACAKQYLEAAKDYAQAARLEPRSIEALLGQQQAALALGDYPGTEYLAKEIARRDANNYLANSRLAWALFSQKRYAKARDVYAKLVALYPADTEMLLGLGYAQSRMGATTQAEASFRAVLSIVPADKRARTGLDELAKK
jgi:tetratricopeptide (TPR) repeat protein